MGSFFVTIGKIAYRFATRAAAQAFAKGRSGAKVVKSAPKGATVRPGPRPQSSVNQPRSATTGQMQKPQPSPARRAETRPSAQTPKKPSTPARQDKAPTSVGRPSTSRTEMTTTSPKQPSAAGTGRGKAPMMPKSMVKERPNIRPKLSSAPGMLRGSAIPDDAPRADNTPSTRSNNKSGEMPSRKKSYKSSGRGDGIREWATRSVNAELNAQYGNSPKTSVRPKARPSKQAKETPKARTPSNTRPQSNPLAGYSDARRQALRSDKIGKDAGDGMKWVVGSNSNALVRTRDEARVKENLRLQKLVKQTKAPAKKDEGDAGKR